MIYFVVNPIAGNGKGEKAYQIIDNYCKEAGIDYKMLRTEKVGHATILAKEACAEENCSAVIAVGGDGTINETLSGMDLRRTFGIVPAGTGNDFNTVINKSTDIKEILKTILSGKTRTVDYMMVSGRRCINVTSMGFDVTVTAYYNKLSKYLHGKFVYDLAVLKTIMGLRFEHAHVKCDNDEFDCEHALIAVGNGRFYGGGIPVTPEAIIDDGFVDLCIIKKAGITKIIPLLLKFLKGTHIKENNVIYRKCKNVIIKGKGILKINTDGELFDSGEFNCSIAGKIRMFGEA